MVSIRQIVFTKLHLAIKRSRDLKIFIRIHKLSLIKLVGYGDAFAHRDSNPASNQFCGRLNIRVPTWDSLVSSEFFLWPEIPANQLNWKNCIGSLQFPTGSYQIPGNSWQLACLVVAPHNQLLLIFARRQLLDLRGSSLYDALLSCQILG